MQSGLVFGYVALVDGMVQRLQGELERQGFKRDLLVMNGSDHLPPQPELPQMLRDLAEEMPDADFEHGSLPEVFRRVRDNLRRCEGFEVDC